MPALNFIKQLAPKVKDGSKRTTIRAYRKDGRNPRPGQTLYLYTGMRTKSCKKLREEICKHTEQIVIDRHGINLKGDWLKSYDAMKVIRADGFDTFDEMLFHFVKYYELPFTGLLIKW